MAKAIKTIWQTMQYPPSYTDWFAATQVIFSHVDTFSFEVITAYKKVLSLFSQKALNALTHATKQNLKPIMPLDAPLSMGPWPAHFTRACSSDIHAKRRLRRKRGASPNVRHVYLISAESLLEETKQYDW